MGKFFQELRRRRVLRTAGAYVIVSWIIVQVIDVVGPALALPDWVMRFAVVSLIAGMPLILILSWFFDVVGGRVQPDQQDDPNVSRPRDFIIIAVLGAALLVSLFMRPTAVRDNVPAPGANNMVAVMPLENLTATEDAAGFVLGLHDDLLTTLSREKSLTVIARDSVIKIAAESLDTVQIGERLGASAILFGSVQRSGTRIRINVRLLDALTSNSLWAESFDRSFDVDGIFEIQSLIARNITRALTKVLAPNAAVADNGVPTTNMEAYRAFLLGKRRVQERTSESLDEAVQKLRRAIALDPQFAAAYAELAMAYSLQTSYSNLSKIELAEIAMPLAQRAVELQPDLAEAHTALADLRLIGGDQRGARESFKRAIELNPNYTRARHWYAILLTDTGEHVKALEEHLVARELDPLSVLLTLNVAQDNLMLNRIAEAVREYEHALEINPNFVATFAHLANINRVAMARHDVAIKWLHDAYSADSGHTEYPSQLCGVYLELEQPEIAARWAAKALALGPEQYWPNRAAMLLGLYTGDAEAVRRHAGFINDRSTTSMTPINALRDVYLDDGDLDAARDLFLRGFPELFGEQPVVTSANYAAAVSLAYVHRQRDEPGAADALLAGALPFVEQQGRAGVFGFEIADVEVQAMLGNYDEALGLLGAAIDDNWRRHWWMLEKNRHLEVLFDDPRFIALIKRLRDSAQDLFSRAPSSDRFLSEA